MKSIFQRQLCELLIFRIQTKCRFLFIPVLVISQLLYSETKNPTDSVVFLKEGNIITITTMADTTKINKQINQNPSAPSAPIILNIDSATQIHMTIKDSAYSDIKYYAFDAKIPGEYHINAWAFYKNLPPGSYTCIIEYPGKLIRHKFLNIE